MGQKNWLVSERAKALATIYITERDDLELRRERDEGGVDYLVEIKTPGANGGRRFGILLYGSKTDLKKADADRTLTLKLRRWLSEEIYPYPVALFYFSVVANTGFYTWLAEPRVVDGVPQLVHRSEADSKPLDRASLDRIVSSVGAWYDAFYASLVVSVSK